MKTRHATLEQLLDIESDSAVQLLELDPLFQRAYQHHDYDQSRHFRRLVRKYAGIEARYAAAQRRANKINHPNDPDFLF